ncbi:MAG: YggS family pyridoxal phosphate-dependent enzyme [Deltaproteobacteria bacterium]|nr:YggS family pyridoxal phosphate-dependent enzyme [Deltaproteobacteria bacterium]MBW2069180.1 YggS family pyridoxal phosphate-dependent enzyme [Deltaproteobacteria bacterium]
MGLIAENLKSVRERIKRACSRAGRNPDSVTLVGVTKTVDPERISAGVEAGLEHVGENYVQEAKKKKEKLDNLKVTWHFIGHLQSNKAKQAVKFFDWIHTLDRQSLAKKLNSAVQKLRTEPLPVLIQVNVGLEDTKSGVHPDELFDLYKSVIHLDGLQVRGLMVIPPFEENPEATRVYFRNLKNLLDRLRDISPTPELLTELSMGMSHDFEVAIEEGATMVRVGTAIFGKRPAK